MDDSKKRQQLLSDILKEGSFESFNANTKASAVRVFERRRRIARVGSIIAICTLTLVSVTFVSMALKRGAPKVDSASIHEPERTGISEPFLISDEELLSYFPPGSCLLANADGNAVLVFRNEEVRRRLFDEPDMKTGL